MLFGLLMMIPYLLVLLVPVVLLVGVIVRGLTLPRVLNRAGGSVCGACAHGVAPGADRCPECGRLYREAGIFTVFVARRTRPGLTRCIFSWTGLCLLLGIFAAGISQWVTYGMGGMTQNVSFTEILAANRDDGLTPTGVPGYEVRFDASVEYDWGNAVKSGTLGVEIRPDAGKTVRIDIDPSDTSWTVTHDGQTLTGSLFDEIAARDVLSAAGFDTSKPYIIRESRDLADAVRLVHRSPEVAQWSVTGNQPYGPGTSAGAVASSPLDSWWPDSLSETGRITSGNQTTVGFESDRYGADQFQGEARLFFSAGPAVALDRVEVMIRPASGDAVELEYVPASRDATITHGTDVHTLSDKWPEYAIAEAMRMIGVATHHGDNVADDLADLIDIAERQAWLIVSTQPASGTAQPASTPGASDGEPDGGLVVRTQSTQNWVNPMRASSMFPLLAAIGIVIVIYIVGIVVIILRRAAIYRGYDAKPGAAA